MRIVTIVGARPQFIKASLMSSSFFKKNINEVIIHTGQHFDKNMSDIFFNEMKIPKPKYNLKIQSLTHGAMTGRQIEEIEKNRRNIHNEGADQLIKITENNFNIDHNTSRRMFTLLYSLYI